MSDKQKQPERFWDWRSALLVTLLGLIAASRLTMTNWTPYLGVTQTLVFLGTLLGFALGYSILYPRNVRRFALAYGLMLIPMQLLTMVERMGELYYDLDLILFRLADAFVLLFQNQPVYDPLFFSALVAIGFWIIGVYAGYQIMRNQHFLASVLPAGIIVLIVQLYDDQAATRSWLFAFYVFLALLLLGRLNFLQSRLGWKTNRVFFTSDAEGDVARVALAFAATVIFIAWSFPGALDSVGPAARAWTKSTKPVRDRLSDAVSAIDSPYRAPVTGDFYGEELALGTSAPIGDTAVLFVKTASSFAKPERYYWRGRVYDHYLNGEWSSSVEPEKRNFNPKSERLQNELSETRVEANLTFTLNFPLQELMYAPSEVTWTDRESRFEFIPTDDEAIEVTTWMASSKMSAGDSYKISSFIANPSIEDLREAGEEYPQWVLDRYLQIPPELEPQFKEIAGNIVEAESTPYDKAQAITNFLRDEIEYTQKLTDTPSRGQDPVEWVLFEYKQGFCMYSASAEVLMLRSLGIPSRMAVGFAQGKYDSIRNRFVVARLDSHAWPEVYFPGIGWVEFEPTGNQDELSRPRRPVNIAGDADEEDQRLIRILSEIDGREENSPGAESAVNPEGGTLTFMQFMKTIYPAFLIGLIALGIFLMRRYSIVDRLPVYLEGRYEKSGRQPPGWLTRWSKWAKLIPIQRAFHTIDRSLRWLGHTLPAHTTPLERASLLADLLPFARADVLTLKEEHETALFTDRPADLERARRASRRIWLEVARARWQKNRSLYLQDHGEKI